MKSEERDRMNRKSYGWSTKTERVSLFFNMEHDQGKAITVQLMLQKHRSEKSNIILDSS